MILSTITLLATLSALPLAAADAWTDKYGGFPDPAFAGVATFAHLDHQRCLDQPDLPLDLAVIGVPYDSAVTFRPGMYPGNGPKGRETEKRFFLGARFGPYGLRSGKQSSLRKIGGKDLLTPFISAVRIAKTRERERIFANVGNQPI